MKLHPYKKFSIKTNLTKDEVVERLNSLKRPKKRWFWNKVPEVVATFKKPENRYYTVEFDGDKFTIYIDFNIKGLGFITNFFRGYTEVGYSPTIDGEILDKGKFRSVKFEFGPTIYSLILYYLFFVISTAVSLFLLLKTINNGDGVQVISVLIYFISSYIPTIFIYFFISHFLNEYFNKMHPFLTNLFDDKE